MELKVANLSESINFFATIGFLMISGRVEVNYFAWICVILDAKFGDDQLQKQQG